MQLQANYNSVITVPYILMLSELHKHPMKEGIQCLSNR